MKKSFLSKGFVLTLCVLFSGVFSCFAQDSYRQTIEQLAKVSGGVVDSKEKIVASFSPILISMGYADSTAKRVAAEYYDEVFYKDVLDWMESVYKPLTSEADLKSAIEFFTSPAGKLAEEHSKIYADEKAQQGMMTKMMPDITKIAMGEKAGKVESDAPKGYQKVFHEYCKLSGMEKSMDVMVSQMLNLMGGNNEKLTKSLSDYFATNLETLMMDLGYPTITEEDLNTYVNFFKTNSGKKISAANSEIIKGAVKFGLSEAIKFQMMGKEKLKSAE